jgi:hypothetical protein
MARCSHRHCRPRWPAPYPIPASCTWSPQRSRRPDLVHSRPKSCVRCWRRGSGLIPQIRAWRATASSSPSDGTSSGPGTTSRTQKQTRSPRSTLPSLKGAPRSSTPLDSTQSMRRPQVREKPGLSVIRSQRACRSTRRRSPTRAPFRCFDRPNGPRVSQGRRPPPSGKPGIAEVVHEVVHANYLTREIERHVIR